MAGEPGGSGAAGRDRLAEPAAPGEAGRERVFALGPSVSQRSLLALLRRELSLRALPSQSLQLTYYDTFDWRLHRRGLRLSTREDEGEMVLALRPASGGEGHAMRVQKIPSFATDLAAVPLRRELEAVTDVRRLLPVVCVELQRRGYAVLDDEEKTVVRLFFERARARGPLAAEPSVELPGTIRVIPVGGYRKAHAAVLEQLAERRGLALVPGDLAERSLEAIGCEPVDRSGGLRCALDPDAPAGAAFLALHRSLFAVMRANERGIREDLDTEYLHDFRVAVRRTRLLHRIFRDELAGTARDALAPGFQWLGRVSNPTRDLDVQLLELRQQRLAKSDEADALLAVEARLRERRREEWEKFVTALDSARYAELEASTAALLDLPQSEAAARIAAMGPPLGPWASARIARAWRRLRKHAARIGEDSPESQLHALRLDGKRLRYLLEFFRSLYAAGDIDPLVKELKRFQETLGAFNDARVQSEMLRDLARDLGSRGASAETLVAIGRLVERAETRKSGERAKFAKRFQRFDGRTNRERFRLLFGSGEKPCSAGPGQAGQEGKA